MEEENHLHPLKPAAHYNKSDQELANDGPFNLPIIISNQKKRSSKLLVYSLIAVVLLSIAFLVFGLVVLRVKSPTLQLSSVTIRDTLHNDASSTLNITLVAEILAHNMNFGRFRFRGGSAILLYGNATIGATNISDGIVGSREKRGMNVTIKVTAPNNDQLSAENYVSFRRDLDSGLLKVTSFAKLRGEVKVVKMMNRFRTAVMNCTMDLNLRSRSVQGLSCQ